MSGAPGTWATDGGPTVTATGSGPTTAGRGFPISSGVGCRSTMAAGAGTMTSAGSGFPARPGDRPGSVGDRTIYTWDGRRFPPASNSGPG